MASATYASISPLQTRQMSGAMSSCSGAFLGEQAAIRQLSSGVMRSHSRSTFQRSTGFAVSQHSQQAMCGSKAETLPSPSWVQDSMRTAVDAVSAAQAVKAVNSPTLPASTWTQAPEPVSQAARCSWPKEHKSGQATPVMFFEEVDEEVTEGQQLHEEFAGELMKRSRSEQLLLDLEEAELGPRSAWPRKAVSTDSANRLPGPRSAWPRTTLTVEAEERVLGPRCAWPRTVLKTEPEERVLGPRCEFPRNTITGSAAAPLVVAGAACAWPRQSQSALSTALPEVEPMYPRCEWPRKEAAMVEVPSAEGPRCAWPAAASLLKKEAVRVAKPSKAKKEVQGWPWAVVPVALEPIPDHDLAQGPRCAWPRVQPQLPVEQSARSHGPSTPTPAGPRCEWPAKQGVPSLSPAAPPDVLGPRCALRVNAPAPAPAPVPVLGAACAWPRKGGVQAVSEDQPPALGPRCPIKLPEERALGPRCALKVPAETVLGPRCALKLPGAEEARVEGPRCAWPKAGAEPVVAPAVEENENVAPSKVQKKRVGMLPRRALFTRIPVRNAKGPSLARIGKVKVARPQPEAGQDLAKPAEKVPATAAWPRRLLATSIGLGALNQALVRSQAQAMALDAPAVVWRRLESYSTTPDVEGSEEDSQS
ncbi:hypothetical protein KFL_001290050 [Klebsormidium nitens]|uniref:Uncharacterized protein n=1 Tax=Klebsormidium nitens TaxID=105231 RepID=A0A1Y1HWA4_KLENI|nr:hypothetical protein KFL_001290050 [Klebsormidium nitens]|eukprot:GAQ82915.1 hypothetical protein KFL_001290050 [Klebsormidium nitens]